MIDTIEFSDLLKYSYYHLTTFGWKHTSAERLDTSTPENSPYRWWIILETIRSKLTWAYSKTHKLKISHLYMRVDRDA